MFSFSPIASSSSGNAYILSNGRSRILLDCGLSWKEIRKRLEFQTADLSGVLVTHSHADHSKGLSDAMKAGLDAYALPQTFEALGLSGHRRNDIQPRISFTIGEWTIIPFEAEHDVPCVGYLIGSYGERALYLTDSAFCRHRFVGLNLIAIECNYSLEILRQRIKDGSLTVEQKRRLLNTHFGLEQLKNMLAANDLSRLQEIHLLHLSDGNSNEVEFKREIQRLTGKPVYVAKK